MARIVDRTTLGPFAPEQGAPAPIPAAAAFVGAAALLIALGGPVGEMLGVGPPWTPEAAFLVGIAGVALSLLALYRVSARGERGRSMALGGLGASTVALLTAYLYRAITEGAIRLDRFFDRYFDVEILADIWPQLVRGAWNTIRASFLAEVLAIVVGLLVATFALSKRRAFHLPAVWYVDFIRGLPIIVLTSLIYFGLPAIGITLSPFVGIVATLTVNASAYIAEIFRAGIQSVARGQMDAARSLGMPYPTAMLFIVIPQAVRAVIPPLMSEFIALIKDSALVYLVVGFTARTADIYGVARAGAASTFSPTPLVAAAIAYLIITVPLARLVGYMERRVRAGLA